MKKRSIFRLMLVVLTMMTLVASHGASVMNNNNHKVEICHFPPGNPENAHTIEVDESAVEAHLEHGDLIGSCPTPPVPEPQSITLVGLGAAGLIGFARFRKN